MERNTMNLNKIKQLGGKVKRLPAQLLSKKMGIQIYVEPRSSKSRSNFEEEEIIFRCKVGRL